MLTVARPAGFAPMTSWFVGAKSGSNYFSNQCLAALANSIRNHKEPHNNVTKLFNGTFPLRKTNAGQPLKDPSQWPKP